MTEGEGQGGAGDDDFVMHNDAESNITLCALRGFKIKICIKKKKKTSKEGDVKEQHVEDEVGTVNSANLGAPTARCSAFGHISNT
jgi:hypothetical protein